MIIVTDNGTIEVPEADQQPTPARQPRPSFGMTWTGTDGATWELCSGPVGLLSGARGFGLPTPQHFLDESPGLHGTSHRGLRYPARDVFLPVELKDYSDMLALERSFFAGLDPAGEGVLSVTAPDAVTRWLRCRYVDGAEGEYEFDPLLVGRATYGLRMLAGDPWWHGEPVLKDFPFQEPSTAGFFPLPPVRVGATHALNRGEVTNPGQAESFAAWRITGPFTGFSVGVGTSVVSATIRKAAGQWVEVDMHPDRLTILDETGASIRSSVTEWNPAPIPPGGSDLVTHILGGVGGEGNSSVRLTFPTLYRRAW